jgi:hypothetical protein
MVDELISDYLGRLNAAAWPLTPTRRAELSAEVREHIETALSEAGNRDESTVRNVLDQLGPPEEIVAAESESGGGSTGGWRSAVGSPAGWAAKAASRGWGALEIIAVLLLIVGPFFLWWLGPIIGIVLVRLSDRWTRHEKGVATWIVLGLLAVQVVVVVIFLALLLPAGGGVVVDQPTPIVTTYK